MSGSLTKLVTVVPEKAVKNTLSLNNILHGIDTTLSLGSTILCNDECFSFSFCNQSQVNFLTSFTIVTVYCLTDQLKVSVLPIT